MSGLWPQLEGLHVFVARADGDIGRAIVGRFLEAGCNVTACDKKAPSLPPWPENIYTLQIDHADEASIELSIFRATSRFGPIHILIANSGPAEEPQDYSSWDDQSRRLWKSIYSIDMREIFLTIQQFVGSTKRWQHERQSQLYHLAVIIIGQSTKLTRRTEDGKILLTRPSLEYQLVKGLKGVIERLNSNATINAMVPGSVITPLTARQADDCELFMLDPQATTTSKDLDAPENFALAVASLASRPTSERASGEYLDVNCKRIVQEENELTEFVKDPSTIKKVASRVSSVSRPLTKKSKHRVRVALSVDFDAISAHLGTGKHPDNNMADYSAGIFAGKVGAPRLVKLFKKLGLAEKMTWFIPGHSMETFPAEVKKQEADVLQRCIELAISFTGKKPTGYRAPLYQIRETTVPLLERHGFEYDSSLTHHDSQPYFLPRNPPIHPPDFSQPASAWMHPTTLSSSLSSLVEIPCNWYGEDETPLSYLPHVQNSHGYVDVRIIEQMWKDRFVWLWENGEEEEEEEEEEAGINDFIFPIVLHPDTSGMAHVIGMIERFLIWLRVWGPEVEFWRYEDIAREMRGGRSADEK
ncbi:MAG: hypothetical protein Q9179_003094 [Wetmoreana sp. 5 TL-2023]